MHYVLARRRDDSNSAALFADPRSRQALLALWSRRPGLCLPLPSSSKIGFQSRLHVSAYGRIGPSNAGYAAIGNPVELRWKSSIRESDPLASGTSLLDNPCRRRGESPCCWISASTHVPTLGSPVFTVADRNPNGGETHSDWILHIRDALRRRPCPSCVFSDESQEKRYLPPPPRSKPSAWPPWLRIPHTLELIAQAGAVKALAFNVFPALVLPIQQLTLRESTRVCLNRHSGRSILLGL